MAEFTCLGVKLGHEDETDSFGTILVRDGQSTKVDVFLTERHTTTKVRDCNFRAGLRCNRGKSPGSSRATCIFLQERPERDRLIREIEEYLLSLARD